MISLFEILLALCIVFIASAMFNRFLPVWFCKHMGWHLEPKEMGFDGCSMNGTCPRCGKQVLQDSQGNWF